jgi:hypothetical protein
MHLDLKVTSDLVHMRGHDGDKPKFNGAVALSVHYAATKTLALSGNGSKWRPLGCGLALYNRAQHRNGRPCLEVYPARFMTTQQSGALNGSITLQLFPA